MSTATPPPYSPATPAEPQHPSAAAHRRGTYAEPPKGAPRTALWVWTGVLSFVVLAIALTIVLQVTASGTYDEALRAYDTASDETVSAQAALSSEASGDADLVTTAQSIVQAASDGLVDTTARDGLTTAATTLSDSVDSAQALAGPPPTDSLPSKPVLFWDLISQAGSLRSETAGLQTEQTQLTDAGDDLDTKTLALDDAATALYATATTVGPTFEAGHIDARNAEVIAFRDAEQAIAAEQGVTSDALAEMTAYSTAATAVVSSEQEELASIAGPLFDARRAAQAFARSIDGGVLVEFDWAPTVNGYGEGGSVSGYTTWNYDHGGHAVILLSDSVAEMWPSDVSMNLIAHEVGHAISSKCPTLYNDQDQASIEAFATAWAISMGYTGDGNGVSIYGQPSDALIAAAATCR